MFPLDAHGSGFGIDSAQETVCFFFFLYRGHFAAVSPGWRWRLLASLPQVIVQTPRVSHSGPQLFAFTHRRICGFSKGQVVFSLVFLFVGLIFFVLF